MNLKLTLAILLSLTSNFAMAGVDTTSAQIQNVRQARDSSFTMLMKATEMYQNGAMTKEKFIEVALQCGKMEKYYANQLNDIPVNTQKVVSDGVTSVGSTVLQPTPTNSTITSVYQIPNAKDPIKTPTGSSTVITCEPGYMTFTIKTATKGDEIACVPRPTVASTKTATPGNKNVEPVNNQCSPGYVLTSAYGPTTCEPLITEVSPGIFRCVYAPYEKPEADANGVMKCVSATNNNPTSNNAENVASAAPAPTPAREPAAEVSAAPALSDRDKQISDLYRNILGRAPDADGLKYWSETGASIQDIRNGFIASDEYKQKN